ncbi:GpE family phage tail protein [Sphingomonas sp. LT1P40]
MADVAVVFHWQPSAMDPMDLPELMRWRRQAEKRVTPEK